MTLASVVTVRLVLRHYSKERLVCPDWCAFVVEDRLAAHEPSNGISASFKFRSPLHLDTISCEPDLTVLEIIRYMISTDAVLSRIDGGLNLFCDRSWCINAISREACCYI